MVAGSKGSILFVVYNDEDCRHEEFFAEEFFKRPTISSGWSLIGTDSPPESFSPKFNKEVQFIGTLKTEKEMEERLVEIFEFLTARGLVNCFSVEKCSF